MIRRIAALCVENRKKFDFGALLNDRKPPDEQLINLKNNNGI